MGWLILLILLVAAAALLTLYGHLTAAGWRIVGAAFALAAFGYALEGQPMLASSFASAPQADARLDPLIRALIEQTKIQPNDPEAWALLAEAFLRKTGGMPTPASDFCAEKARALGQNLGHVSATK